MNEDIAKILIAHFPNASRTELQEIQEELLQLTEVEVSTYTVTTDHNGKLFTVNGTDEVQFHDGTIINVMPE